MKRSHEVISSSGGKNDNNGSSNQSSSPLKNEHDNNHDDEKSNNKAVKLTSSSSTTDDKSTTTVPLIIEKNTTETNTNKQLQTLHQLFTSILTSNLEQRLVLNPLDIAIRDAQIISLPQGLFLEFGVFSGKTINQMARLLPRHLIHGFDTFTGLPERWRDGFEKSKFDRKGQFPQVLSNVKLYAGLFQDTLGPFLNSYPGPVSVVHCDADLYSATYYVLSTLAEHHRIVPGTLIVFDELINYPQYREGEWKALLECTMKFQWDIKFLYQSAMMETNPVLDIFSAQQVGIRIDRIGGVVGGNAT
jgi:hypothetical protein